MVSGPVVGIDLGTTNSVVASVDDDGRVVILPSAVGGEITPSVVYFEPDGTAVVGEEALQATAVDPENGVQLIKRNMGTEFPLTIRGQDHTPESISALILRQLAAAAAVRRAARSAPSSPSRPTSAWPNGRPPTRPASSPGWTCSGCLTNRWPRPLTTA